MIKKLWNLPGIFRLPADSQDSHRWSLAFFVWESSGSWKTPGGFQCPNCNKSLSPVAKFIRLDLFQQNSSNGGYGRNQLNAY
jgi:hypothetical protein